MTHEHGRGGRAARAVGILTVVTGVLGAPIAWTLHLFASYLLLTIGCTTGWRGTIPAIVIVTIIFAAAAFASGIVAFRKWRGVDAAPDFGSSLSEPRSRELLWMIGILSAVLFGATILLAGLPSLLVPLCS